MRRWRQAGFAPDCTRQESMSHPLVMKRTIRNFRFYFMSGLCFKIQKCQYQNFRNRYKTQKLQTKLFLRSLFKMCTEKLLMSILKLRILLQQGSELDDRYHLISHPCGDIQRCRLEETHESQISLMITLTRQSHVKNRYTQNAPTAFEKHTRALISGQIICIRPPVPVIVVALFCPLGTTFALFSAGQNLL